jgi:hypothetical protein
MAKHQSGTLLPPEETQVAPLGSPTKEVAPIDHGSAVDMFERLARDPNASVDKIERLMALWERVEAKKAETAFNVAMSEAQKQIRPVFADQFNKQTSSKYASYEAIDAVARPVYSEHGFALSFDTGYDAPPDHVRVLCYVSHLSGHARTYHADMPADGKGARGGDVMTRTHAAGSAMSYGQRYLLKLIFNIPISDDDGNKAGATAKERQSPEGYDKWLEHLRGVAEKGITAFTAAWTTSDEKFARHIPIGEYRNLKTRAMAVKDA